MARINNSAVIQKLVDELELYPGKDVIPTELADKILPVFNVNSEEVKVTVVPEYATIVKQAIQSNVGSTTLYTVESTDDFYLTDIIHTCNCTAGTNWSSLNVVIDGVTVEISELHTIWDAIATANTSINLASPVKIDAGSDIVINNSANTCRTNITILGYYK